MKRRHRPQNRRPRIRVANIKQNVVLLKLYLLKIGARASRSASGNACNKRLLLADTAELLAHRRRSALGLSATSA